MNDLSSLSGFQWKGKCGCETLWRFERMRIVRNFSAFSLIVPPQCNLKFSLLHWKSHSAEKNYYNSWISGRLKAKMVKVSGPTVGPTTLRYFKWEICVFRGENWKTLLEPENFLIAARHFIDLLNMDGSKFSREKSLFKDYESRKVCQIIADWCRKWRSQCISVGSGEVQSE